MIGEASSEAKVAFRDQFCRDLSHRALAEDRETSPDLSSPRATGRIETDRRKIGHLVPRDAKLVSLPRA